MTACIRSLSEMVASAAVREAFRSAAKVDSPQSQGATQRRPSAPRRSRSAHPGARRPAPQPRDIVSGGSTSGGSGER